jgi:hypothetical protein
MADLSSLHFLMSVLKPGRAGFQTETIRWERTTVAEEVFPPGSFSAAVVFGGDSPELRDSTTKNILL